jgi:hypothetical protein
MLGECDVPPLRHPQLLWLTFTAALATGWWLDHARLKEQPADELGVEINECPIHVEIGSAYFALTS